MATDPIEGTDTLVARLDVTDWGQIEPALQAGLARIAAGVTGQFQVAFWADNASRAIRAHIHAGEVGGDPTTGREDCLPLLTAALALGENSFPRGGEATPGVGLSAGALLGVWAAETLVCEYRNRPSRSPAGVAARLAMTRIGDRLGGRSFLTVLRRDAPAWCPLPTPSIVQGVLAASVQVRGQPTVDLQLSGGTRLDAAQLGHMAAEIAVQRATRALVAALNARALWPGIDTSMCSGLAEELSDRLNTWKPRPLESCEKLANVRNAFALATGTLGDTPDGVEAAANLRLEVQPERLPDVLQSTEVTAPVRPGVPAIHRGELHVPPEVTGMDWESVASAVTVAMTLSVTPAELTNTLRVMSELVQHVPPDMAGAVIPLLSTARFLTDRMPQALAGQARQGLDAISAGTWPGPPGGPGGHIAPGG